MLMNYYRLHDPVLLMKLGGDPDLSQNPSLGQAISHAMQQPTEEQWLFDIVTDDGLMTYTIMKEIAQTDEFALWKNGGSLRHQQ
jgi:hypothetical protein